MSKRSGAISKLANAVGLGFCGLAGTVAIGGTVVFLIYLHSVSLAAQQWLVV